MPRLSSPGFDVHMLPVSVYQVRALEAMLAHLREGTPLPDSQVIHPVPRPGRPGQAAPTTTESLPLCSLAPSMRIGFPSITA
ncbi:3-hydroxybutyrate oligomer hydrolase family protein [Cupriavidus necator]|uniref:3-hydroxybutyrate oligomer hydrolase family protein n=1 Tax=Cupriavidus necator TaxID=106590 RepID=UPI0039C0550E